MIKQNSIKLFIGIILISNLANAKSIPPKDRPDPSQIVNLIFQDLDTNADESISKKEAQSDLKISSDFSKIDTNRDNAITSEELSTFMVNLAKTHQPPTGL